MSEAIAARSAAPKLSAGGVLAASAVVWAVPALIGQAAFAFYILIQYGLSAATGDFAAWNEVMRGRLVQGDAAGNAATFAHIFVAFAITVSGCLQIIPLVRNRARAFHRWNGRFYVAIAVLTSLAGLYMVWSRSEGMTGPATDLVISGNAVLILICAAMAARLAIARRLREHERWALRLFMVVSGVWFLRLGFGFLVLLYQGPPPGIGENLDGPTFVGLTFASYLAPLAVLELYFRAKDSRSAPFKLGAAAVVLLCAILTAVGVAGAALVFWLPRLSA